MSAVVSGTKAKLENLWPGKIGDNRAYSTSYVESLIMAGFYEVCDRCDLVAGSENVTLEADTLEYDLDSSFIEVTSVEFIPGDTQREGQLTAVTLSDMDKMSRKWRDDRGARPEFYSLLSAPGIPETSTDAADGSKILVYRPMSSVSDDLVRVNGVVAGTAATATPEDVQRLCIVPYVMAHLKAVSDPKSAVEMYRQFVDGCERVSGRFRHRYTETISKARN